MSYQQFAFLYDSLMSDVPYEDWVSYTKQMCREHGAGGTQVLDVACGTGSIAVPLLRQGFSVTGVDLSDDMLVVAQQKLAEQEFHIPLYQQDMRELDVPGPFDIVTIFCDSLNYLTEEADVKRTFTRVREHMKDDGLFLFDVHSIYKMEHIFLDETFTVNEEDIALIWHCFPGEYENSVEHDMTFFVQGEDTGLYERFDELHVQRAYPLNRLIVWLEEAGLTAVSVTGNFGRDAVTEETERIFFAAKKKPD